MVATVRQISSSSNSGKYFYFTEKNFESGKGWHDSKGIAFLSIDKLTRENFEAVLDGRILEKVEAGGKEEVIERVLGKKTADGLEHNPGRELIFSSPKSVSIMGLVAGDKRVLDAHEKSVSAVLDYYERNMVFARVQRDGVLQHEKTDNMIAAKFTHICSRVNKDNESTEDKKLDIPDPQLHTHCILANVTKCKDGIWRSIVFDKMYDHKMHLGELYRTELGYNLQRIGYELEFQKDKANRWTFEIASVPKEDIATFSKRREKILEVAEQIKRRDSESLALIAKATRQEKVSCTRDSLQENWEMRAMSLEHLRGIINSSVYHTAEKDIKSKLALSIKHLSEREAVLSKASIIEDLIQKSASDFSIGEIEKGLAECIAEGKLLATYRGDQNSFTTPANLKAERRMISLMQSLLGAMRPLMDTKEINENIRAKGLTVGQSDAVYLALSTSDRVIGLQGSAGAGKTTVLRTIKECLAAKDYEILGLAPTKSAACTMSDEAGIQAMTMQLFLAKYAGVLAGRGTASGMDKMRSSFKSKIVVLDEAGLASTEQMHGLLTLSKELKFRLMMLGDVKQLCAVGTGKPFHYLQEHGLNTVSMNTIKRQQNKELLKSVVLAESAVDAEIRDSKKLISKSLEVLGEKNILDLSKQSQNASGVYTNEDFARALYNKWKELKARGITPLVIVTSNPMRLLVNAKIRTNYVRGCDIERSVLRSKGLTLASALHIGSYEVGDVLLLNKGDDYLTVCGINRQEGCLTLKNGTREITLSATNLARMRQGALEVFKPYVLPLAEGEHIKWTRNSKTHNFAVNGASARVRKLREGYITVETADKKLHKLSLSDQVLQHIDHDYSSTVYGAQGKTVDHVIGVCRAREKYIDLSTQRALYVMLSRAKHEAFLITDEHERLIKALSIKTGAKYSAIEHLKSSDATDIKALETNRREVWIEKQDAASGPSLENSGIEKSIRLQKIKPSLGYNNFICSPDLIRQTACDAFGSVNEKLSKAENLRFGRRGHIAVNLNTGQWYDFKTGSGGSLHAMFKDESATHNNYEQNIKYLLANTEKSSKIEKIAAVHASYKRSININHTGATLGARYFAEHRKIDLSQINLSEDVRFIGRHFSSESKSYHPAIVSFARDQDGKITAAQTIFLDLKDANKNKSLEVTKRTFGSLKGSFVEVTRNKDSKIILIAEGLETSLSLAEANPDLRVICSLGISNIRNLVFNQDSKVIICADNDGASSNTNFVIEKAAETLRERGVKSVSIVRPDSAGYDFNDVLKSSGVKAVKQYIEPLISKPRSWESIFAKLQADIKEHRTLEQTLQKSVCFNVYKDRRSALKNWNTLAKEKGLEKSAGEVLKNPEVLGKMRGINLFGLKTPSRTKALNTIQSDVKSLVQINYHQKAIKAKEKRLKELRHLFIQRYLSAITKLNTKNLDIDTIKEKILKSVLHALKASDNIINYKSASSVATRIAEQIVHYRIRFNKEASSAEKLSFFSRARFEESRRGLLSAALEEKLQPKTIGQRLAFNQKLSRLLEIDSKNAIKQCDIYYKAAPIESSIKMLESGDKKIEALEKEYIAQGMNASVARFSSIETVKYEEAQGKHMPLKLREILRKIAPYVKSNYNQLLKCGFSKEEAIVAYNEGAKLFMQAAQHPKTISLGQVKAAQEISKNEFVTHAKNVHSTTITPANQAVQKQQNAHITMREFEIGG